MARQPKPNINDPLSIARELRYAAQGVPRETRGDRAKDQPKAQPTGPTTAEMLYRELYR